MYCQVYFVLCFLFLFVCPQLFGRVCAVGTLQEKPKINENTFFEFLKPVDEKIKTELQSAGVQQDQIAGTTIESVFLAAADGVIVALTELDHSVTNEKKFFLVEKYIEADKEKWKEEVVKKGGDDWKTQLVTKNDKNIEEKAKFKSSAVVVKGNKIYYFSLNNSKFEGDAAERADDTKWRITFVVGNVASGKQGGKKTITWETWDSTKLPNAEKLKTMLNHNPVKIPPAVGFLIEDKIVFAIQGEAKEPSENKYVTVFFQLEKREQTEELKEFHVQPTGNCYFSLFLWKEKIFMIPIACSNGDKSNQKIKAFDYKQKQFNESYKSFACLQEFLKDKKHFVTTKIDTTTDALLFTRQRKNTSSGKYEVYLWVTDGNRTANVGTIITGSKDTFDLSMLHINNELFLLYNNYETGGDNTNEKFTYNLQRLPDQLEKIKLILGAWKNADNKIKEFFKEATTDTSSFTNALVGFLSNDSQNNDYWKDEYFYENATVTGNGTRDAGGFKFSGANAGAKWLVGKPKKEDQPYNFAVFGFTLVATVKIDDDANEKWNSILGVGLGGNEKKTIGLWCSGGMWGVADGKNTEAAKFTSETCVQGEKYRVVLTMKDTKISVYIDGKLVEGLPKNPIEVQEKDITHFYFGINNAEKNTQSTNIESHVTVTNVLLYNRPFEEKEVKNLKECEKTPKVIKKPEENLGTNTQGDEQQPTPPPAPIGNEKRKEDEAKDPSPSRTEDGGVGGGVRVFSLLLAVLCVSAPLLHL